jgi:dTDP-4-dehydrorhamnose reductase
MGSADHRIPRVWAGFECARVRVRGRVVDQLELTGHASRATDIDTLAWLGVEAVRYPILWERVAPRGLAQADWRWTDERLARLAANGVRPIAGLLHHGSGPRGMSLAHPGFTSAFARYAAAVAQRYPWIDAYLPVNEPLTTARFAGLYGLWHPHQRSEPVFARLLLAQCLAIRAAMEAIRGIRPDARLIVNEDLGRTYGTVPLAGQVAHANERRWLTWDLLSGAVDERHPMWATMARSPALVAQLEDLAARPCPPDLIGIDHYVTSDRFLDHRVEAYPAAVRPTEGQPDYVDVEALRVPEVASAGVAGVLREAWERYRRPIALTEVALAGEAHDQVAWWDEAWSAALDAARDGVPLEAVTAWALVGASGWDRLLSQRDARYEPGYFDARFDTPMPRPVAHAVRATALGRDPADPAGLERPVPGWWRRDDRFLWLPEQWVAA